MRVKTHTHKESTEAGEAVKRVVERRWLFINGLIEVIIVIATIIIIASTQY